MIFLVKNSNSLLVRLFLKHLNVVNNGADPDSSKSELILRSESDLRFEQKFKF